MMSESFTVELSESQFEVLEKMAGGLGKQPGELGTEWVVKALQRIAEDPLLKYAGAVNSGISDLAERHDHYMGEAIAAEMRGSDE
ncbi:MAG: hypothetical protein COZ05_03225 [Armatimonadetes bacterium CG_4_10_14_3_um_filter_59_10]|nr:MAG: hypothetical protein COZ05_03225 [Armatimonadetes bacterium CG_4_10_14_3_um_filter_59_10]PJB77878.1 MAG: hypothetical protein CO095_01120 [Armatimonadetes bacterium CG_4_9_14_3_um_filter_58_7]